MMLRTGTALALAALLLVSIAAHAADATAGFLQTHYYLLSLGHVAADTASIRQTAQSSGFSIIAYDANSVEAYRGGIAVATAPESVLSDERLLVVDGGQFLLRASDDGFGYTVRPSESGYELVIDPQQDLAIGDVLGTVLISLQELGILGNQLSLAIDTYAKDDPKGPAPPDGIAIDSTLYGLRVARDWFGYATAKGLAMTGLRIEVIAEMLPGAALSAGFTAYVVEQAEGLVKLSLPVDRLLALAGAFEVAYLRPPYRPSVP